MAFGWKRPIKSGSEISIFYDPMIAKLIVWDKSRSAAHRKMQYVLRNLICLGTTTNQSFLLRVLENSDFQKGKYDTHFVNNFKGGFNLPINPKMPLFTGISAVLYNWKKRENSRTILRNMPFWLAK